MSYSDYIRYRGKCKEFCDKAILDDPSLVLVRGYYVCPLDGKQEHWWCVKLDGTIFDPTVKQFKTNGAGAEYEEFNGWLECEECGKRILEEDAIPMGRYGVCSNACAKKLVGI